MTTGYAALYATDEARVPESTRASSFYTAMRIMPPSQRKAMYEIYKYCRILDDIADEEGECKGRLEQLDKWRNSIVRIYEGKPPPSLQGLARAVSDFSLRKQDMLALVDGMEMDVRGPIQAPDFAMLNLYCDRVACAVGRLSVRIFGMRERDGLNLSHHLGSALQLTNILRDIDEDSELGRLYLPRELLEKAGITDKNPAKALANPTVADACDKLADKALTHFNKADDIMKNYSRKHLRTPRIMSQAYRSILIALTERGFTPPRYPVHLSKIRLGYILVRNILF